MGTRQRKGVTDIRTPLGARIHAAPRQEDSAHLQAYLLLKEQERLRAERAVLAKRIRQIEKRLEEIRAATEKLRGKAPAETLPITVDQSAPEGQTVEDRRSSEPGKWSMMTLEY